LAIFENSVFIWHVLAKFNEKSSSFTNLLIRELTHSAIVWTTPIDFEGYVQCSRGDLGQNGLFRFGGAEAFLEARLRIIEERK
jgi:hypothetical protein